MKIFKQLQRALLILLILLMSLVNSSFGQIISTNAAYISVSSGTVLSSDSILNNSTGTINNSGTFKLQSINNAGSFLGSGTYFISKNITNTGSFLASTATLNLNGSSAQTLAANFTNKQVNNFIISNTNASGITLADSLNVLNSVSFGNVNNAILTSAGYLVLKSTASNTAYFADATNANINSGNLITGNVSVERYLPVTNVRGYRFLAPSVNSIGSIHANWQEGATSNFNNPKPGYGTHITGTRTDQLNGFDGTQTGNPSMYTYDPVADAFITFPNTDVLKLIASTSYIVYFRGDRSINIGVNFSSQGSTSTTLRAFGTLVQGNSTVSSNTVSSTAPNGGYSLISNPYAAPVSWVSFYNGNLAANISNYYTYYDPKINGGAYVTVNTSGTRSNVTSTATTDIQSGQAFFIQALGTAPTVTFKETYKSTNNNTGVFKSLSSPQILYSSLFIRDTLGRRNADGVANVFDPSFNNLVDKDDATEIENFNENIAIIKFGHHLAIEELTLPTSTPDTIRYYLSNLNVKDYDLEFKADQINPAVNAVLVDNFTGLKTNLSLDTATVVPFSVTTAPASKDSNRFYVILNPLLTLPLNFISFYGVEKNNGNNLTWKTAMQTGIDDFLVERSSDGSNFSSIGTVKAVASLDTYEYFDATPFSSNNFYRIKTTDKLLKATYSKIIQLRRKNENTFISVYPNPVINKSINLVLNNIPKGQFILKLYSKSGQLIFSQPIEHDGSNNPRTINLIRKLPKGSYDLIMGAYSTALIVE